MHRVTLQDSCLALNTRRDMWQCSCRCPEPSHIEAGHAETVKSILDGVTVGTTKRADAHDLVVAKADEELHKLVQETAILAQVAHIDLPVTDCVTTQQEDPILKTAIEWISGQKVEDLKHLLGDDTNTEEGKTILLRAKEANALPRSPLPSPYLLLVNGKKFCAICGPQGSLGSCHEWMSLWCWTPRPTVDTVLAAWPVLAAKEWLLRCRRQLAAVKQCTQHKGIHGKASLWPIIVTAPLELLHIHFTSIETMMELDQPPNSGECFGLLMTTLWSTLWHIWPQINLQNCC